jgi:pimeloyl-ACP methyl ester carboxylesterase
LNRRIVLRGALLAPGVAVTLAGCDTRADGEPAAAAARSAINDYVAAPPQSRTFTPPPELDRRGEGHVDLPQADGARLYFWDTGGGGEAIVLVHAATGSAYSWGYQQRAFAAAGYRVIAYSRRGYRGSDAGPADDRGRARADSGRPLDDLDAVADRLGLGEFHLLGHAGGAGIANGYMKMRPERILSAISAAAIQGIADEDWTKPANGIRAPGEPGDLGSFNSNPAEFREVGASYRWANPEGLAAWQELERTNRPVAVEHAAGVQVTWTDIESRTFPTLLIAGDADLYAPPSMYRYLHSRVPNSELHVISESGHSVYWEQPDVFNDVVLAFLAANR